MAEAIAKACLTSNLNSIDCPWHLKDRKKASSLKGV